MEFEYDGAKSESNKAKHGIDFDDAQLVWEDADRILIPARTEGEPRYMLVGRIGEKHWSAIFTTREDRIRIISVRRAQAKEIELYED